MAHVSGRVFWVDFENLKRTEDHFVVLLVDAILENRFCWWDVVILHQPFNFRKKGEVFFLLKYWMYTLMLYNNKIDVETLEGSLHSFFFGNMFGLAFFCWDADAMVVALWRGETSKLGILKYIHITRDPHINITSSNIYIYITNVCYFHPYLGKWSNFDDHIFQMGWFNHQLDKNYTYDCHG